MHTSVNLFGFLLLNGFELLDVENLKFISLVFIATHVLQHGALHHLKEHLPSIQNISIIYF